MSAWWTFLLLLATPTGQPPASAHAPERESPQAVDFAQLALGDWVAARRELLRELEALERRGTHPGASRKLQQWRARDLDAEVRHIQDGFNAARHRMHPR